MAARRAHRSGNVEITEPEPLPVAVRRRDGIDVREHEVADLGVPERPAASFQDQGRATRDVRRRHARARSPREALRVVRPACAARERNDSTATPGARRSGFDPAVASRPAAAECRNGPRGIVRVVGAAHQGVATVGQRSKRARGVVRVGVESALARGTGIVALDPRVKRQPGAGAPFVAQTHRPCAARRARCREGIHVMRSVLRIASGDGRRARALVRHDGRRSPRRAASTPTCCRQAARVPPNTDRTRARSPARSASDRPHR